jgi:hypothetical protein
MYIPVTANVNSIDRWCPQGVQEWSPSSLEKCFSRTPELRDDPSHFVIAGAECEVLLVVVKRK